MVAAGALFLLGAGLTAAGMLWSGLYDIGILVLIVAAIGIVVRIGDLARILLASRTGGDRPWLALPGQRRNGGERP